MSEHRLKLTSVLLSSTVLATTGPALAQEAEIEPSPSDEIVVRGAFIPDEKRVTSEITSLLDAQDFAVAGDADIASALTRITGISVQAGKFAVVRGLNDRYSNTILNGSGVSSPEPLRRAVPLDMFPTSLIGQATVQKTYAPEYYLDFGGGVIALETSALPDGPFLEVGVSGGVNSATTLRDGLLHNGGGDSDYTSFDDGTRNLPDSLGQVFEEGQARRVDASLDADLREQIGVDLANFTDYVVQQGDIAGNAGASIEGGTRVDFSRDFSMGVIAAVDYGSDWQTLEGVRREIRQGSDGIEIRDDFDRVSTEHQVDLSGLLAVGFDILDNHTITATGLHARSSLKETRVLEGFQASEGRTVREDNTEWFERQVWMTQLAGEHFFPSLNNASINWRAAYSEAFRDAPFNRLVRYELRTNPATGEEVFSFRGRSQDDTRTDFSKIEDDSTDIGVDLVVPVSFLGRDWDLKAGYGYFEKNRDTLIRQFSYNGVLPSEALFTRIDAIISPANVQNGTLSLVEVGGTLFPAQFRGLLEIDAAYVGVDTQLFDFVRVAVGGRFEEAIQIADTFDVGEMSGIEAGEDVTNFDSAIESEYFLPAVTLTWNFIEDVQLRLAYSQTIARPQFRETAFAIFNNTETDRAFRGNPFLTNSEFDNFDARLEYYFARGEFITIGGFYKTIDNPIEEFSFSLGERLASTFVNIPSAEVYGLEFEFEKSLPISEWLMDGMGWQWDWLEPKSWFFKTNYTLTQSEIDAEGEIRRAVPQQGRPQLEISDGTEFVVDGRNLQGLSEHLFNFQLGYEDEEARSRATILLNFTGERIRTAENLSSGFPAVIEQPPLLLDFVYSREFEVWGGEYEFGFQIDNILDDDYEAEVSDETNAIFIDQYDLGRSFSVSLKRRF